MKQNNLGNYDTIYDVWSVYPEGGKEGDYLFIGGVKCVWDKYDNKWMPEVSDEDKTLESFYGEVDIHKGLHVGEDVVVNGNLIAKGAIISKKVSQPSCGLFSSVEALQKAYPKPYVGMWAAVGDAVPAPIYRCETIGVWTPTGDIGYADGPQGEKGDTGERGPQGPQGNSGYTGAAGELEVVNDLSQGGAAAALSAEMGKELTRYANYGRLVCRGEDIVSIRLYQVQAGRAYRLHVKTPDWDVSSLGDAYGDYEKFSIKAVYDDGTTENIYLVTILPQSYAPAEGVAPTYLFTCKANIDYIRITARGVDGEIIEVALEDVTDLLTSGYYFDGRDDYFSSTAIFLEKNRSYHIRLSRTSWNCENRKYTDTAIWNIYYPLAEGGSKSILFESDFATLKQDFYFSAPQDGLYYFGGRADLGERVYFSVEDISERWENIIVSGKGEGFSSVRLYNISEGNYRLTVLNFDEWDSGTLEEDIPDYFHLELYYYNSAGELVRPVARQFGGAEPLRSSYEFQIKGDVDPNRVYLGCRAVDGVNVRFRLDLLQPISRFDSNKSWAALVGANNAGVTSYVTLGGGIKYTCYLPKNRWDLTGVTINYDYSYFQLDYMVNGASAKLIKYLSSFKNDYTSSFTFTAPASGKYRIYIRATDGIEVPVFFVPSAEGEFSAFSEQMQKAAMLGFKRNPTSVTEGYIPTLSFAHISDTHCLPTKYLEPLKHTVGIFNELAKNGVNKGRNLKFLLHTGDVRNAQFNDGYDFFAPTTEALSRNVFVTPGNHDVGNSDKVALCGTDEQLYAEMIEPMLDKWSLKSDGGGTPHPEGKCYYFNDYTEEKIRLIVLYEYETDFELSPEDSSLLLYGRSGRAFRQEQIDWLIYSLLTVPAGYGVVIAKHQPESVKGEWDNPFFSNVARIDKTEMYTYCGTELIAQIVQGFIDRTTINITVEQTGGVVTTLYANADFSAVAEDAEFICYCSGHTHQDVVTFLRDYPKQLELTIGCNNVHYTEGSDMLQEEGGKSEVLMNIYNIDRNRGYVYIVRIGADFSNTAQNRSFTAIKYRKNE